MTKRAGPGAQVDIPMNHKDALYVRSFYDGMTLTLPDAPQADEIALITSLCEENGATEVFATTDPEEGEEGFLGEVLVVG